jgi:purine-binding chemotaxis protein CheW
VNQSAAAAAIEAGAVAREYVTFVLGTEEYGIDILTVQEIRGYDAVTRIANAPAYIKGVINLRGAIVPIVDLRIKFALGTVTYDAFTVVIILNVRNRTVGIVVDGVSDVITLADEQIREVPPLAATIDTGYLSGLCSVNDKLLILVDIERLMTSAEMQLFDETIGQ